MQVCDQNNNKVKITCPFPLINAVLEGLQEGNIFKDEFEEYYFVIHKAGFSYLTIGSPKFYSELFDLFVKSNTVPRYFHIYEPPNELLSICGKDANLINTRIRKRIQLKYNSSGDLPTNYFLPQGYKINKIDEQNFERMDVFKLNLDSKFWKSKIDFIEKGFGFYISDERNNPVSICYTACINNKIAEIDIATLEEFRKLGLAKAAVTEFVQLLY